MGERQANFWYKTGERRALFLAKIQALDGRKDGQNSSFCIKKRINSTRDIITTKVVNLHKFWMIVHLGEIFIQHVI